MRIRSIKPAFFKDEDLAELPALTRILFAALWSLADGQGRLEYRPKYIKAECLPYDPVKIEPMLESLDVGEFIQIYESAGRRYIQIVNFRKHQRITGKEAEEVSPFPAPGDRETTGKQSGNNGETPDVSGREGSTEGKGMDISSPSGSVVPAPAGPTPEHLFALWNEKAHPNLPRADVLSDRRIKSARCRLREHPDRSFWDGLMEKINRSKFLNGESDRFKCTFDWILNETNLIKITEGNYDGHR